MKLICDLLEIGIQVKIENEKARFNEIWLAESTRTAWDLWTKMGWSGDMEKRVTIHDWLRFRAEPDKCVVMDSISRLNRIARENRTNLLEQFDQGWLLILEIVAEIQRKELWFEQAPEVNTFRKTVAFFIAYGIKRGVEKSAPCNHEQFIFPAHRVLHDGPIRPLLSQEIKLEQGRDQTVVSVSDPSAFALQAHSHAVFVISV